MTYEDHLASLGSNDPSDRAVAGLLLNRSDNPEHREAVKRMVQVERHYVVIMILCSCIVGWGDEALERLLQTELDERALYALLYASQIQKRTLSDGVLRSLSIHPSIFVRLVAMRCAFDSGIELDFESLVEQARRDSRHQTFTERPYLPDPVFTNRTMFLRRLRTFKQKVSPRQ